MSDPLSWSCAYCRSTFFSGEKVDGRLDYSEFNGGGTLYLCWECATILKDQVVKGRVREKK